MGLELYLPLGQSVGSCRVDVARWTLLGPNQAPCGYSGPKTQFRLAVLLSCLSVTRSVSRTCSGPWGQEGAGRASRRRGR